MSRLNSHIFSTFIFALGLLFLIPASAATKYSKYTNTRFGYSISYASDLFIPQGESENGDGQKFVAKDKEAILLVYGSYNVLDQSLEEYLGTVLESNADAPDQEFNVTYKVMKKNFFIISGTIGTKIIYQKTILRSGIFKSFRLVYDQSQKSTYDPLIKNLLLSFKG